MRANRENIINIFLLLAFQSTSMACGDSRYTGNEDRYAVKLLYNYYSGLTDYKNACLLAEHIGPIASGLL
jgi:hypothetical protein